MDFIEICNHRNIIPILEYLKAHNTTLINGYNLVVLDGNLELIKWFLSLDTRLYNTISITNIHKLILNSNNDILEWLLENTNSIYTNIIHNIINSEFREGRLELLENLVDIQSVRKYINRNIISILKVLICENLLDALVWLNINFKNILYTFDDYSLYFISFRKGYSEIGEWLIGLDVKPIYNYNANNVFIKACVSGYLELAKMFYRLYSISNILECFNSTCSEGRLDVAMWLYSINNINDLQTAYIDACNGGKLDVIEWLLSIDEGCIDIISGIRSVSKNNDEYTLTYLLEHLGERITINDLMELFNYSDRIRYVVLNTLDNRGELGEMYGIFSNNRELCYYIVTNYPSIRLDFTPYLKLYIIEEYNELCLEIYNNHLEDIHIEYSDICSLFTTLALYTNNTELLELLYNLNSVAVDSIADSIFISVCENSYIDVAIWLYNKYIGRYNVVIDRYNMITSFGIIKPLDIIGGVYLEAIEDCSICIDTYSDSITECRHQFCYECLNKWYLLKRTCPICRSILHFCSNLLALHGRELTPLA